MSQWTLFSNHGHVLFCLVKDPGSRLRDVAADVGITERAVQKIVRDLQDVGILSVTKDGRRNRYRIDKSKPLRHALEAHRTIADLIRFIEKAGAKVSVDTQDDVSRADIPPVHAGSVDEAEDDSDLPAVTVPAPIMPEPVKKKQAEPPPVVPAEKVEPAQPDEKPGKEKQAGEEREESKPENLVEKQQGSLF